MIWLHMLILSKKFMQSIAFIKISRKFMVEFGLAPINSLKAFTE